MKPIRLNIQGINSFIQEESIDFSRLTDKGIFGIFGPTGSGKSSILDAITLALYDTTARGTREFINKEVDKATILFEFSIKTPQGDKVYVAERGYKKDKYGNTRTVAVRLYEKNDTGEHIVIAEKSKEMSSAILDIIGLSYDDFSRSVVLPQGKFSEFLTLENKDRRNMLERIFHLEKYGKALTDKINKKTNIIKTRIGEINNSLEYFKDVSQENMDYYTTQAEKIQQEIVLIKESIKNQNKNVEQLKFQLDSNEQKKIYLQRLSELKSQEERILTLKQTLENIEKFKNVKPYIERALQLKTKISKEEIELGELENLLKTSNETLEVAKQKHQVAQDKKINQYPVLMGQQESAKQAYEINKEVQELDEVVTKLQNQYKDLGTDLNAKKQGFNKVKNDIDRNLEKIEGLIKDKGNFTVSAEIKKQIQEGYIIEISKNEHIKTRDVIDKKLKDSQSKTEGLKENVDKSKTINVDLDEKIKKLAEKIKSLEMPITHQELSQKQMEIVELELSVSTLKINEGKQEKLTQQIKDIETKIAENKEELQSLQGEFDKLSLKTDELENHREKMNLQNFSVALATKLGENQPCPVCGSTHHPLVATNMLEDSQDDLLEEIKEHKLKVDEVSEKINQQKISLQSNENLKQRLLEEFEAIEKSEVSSQQLETEVKDKKELLKTLQQKLEEYETDIAQSNKTLSDLNEDKVKEDRNLYELENALKLNLSTIDELEKQKTQEDEFIASLKSQLENIDKEIYENSSFKAESEKISEKEKQLEIITKSEDELRKEIDTETATKEKLQQEISDLERKLETILVIGKEKSSLCKQRKAQVLEITKGEDPSEMLKRLEKQIKEILDDESTMSENLKKENENNIKLNADKSQAVTSLENTKTEAEEVGAKVDVWLSENGFSSTEEVSRYDKSEAEINEFKATVLEYEKNCIDVKSNIDRLNGVIKDETVTKEQIQELESQIVAKNTEVEEFTKTQAIYKQRVEDIKGKMAEKNSMLTQLDDLKQKFYILDQISTVTKGNGFVEYLAAAQLKYITIEASKRLKQITNNRYALELDGSDFIMRDDHNAGTRRNPATLSGGEVFLTSFALALALSSKIQMRNSAPLEFFFLDEGFGTLDVNLLEMVMVSLENLKKDNLCVGIITHVEDIKNRIPIKLAVTPARQGISGTKVDIEYS